MAPIMTHAAKQILRLRRVGSLCRSRRASTKLAEFGSAIHDVVPTVMVYQSAVRNGDGEFTSGQPMEDR